MTPTLALIVITGYFGALPVISLVTSRRANARTFFTANHSSPWYLVAFGMIGATLSGVTFISIPGWVATTQFSYMQMVMGYILGYIVVATVLMPLYYRIKLVSIYGYLEQRYDFWSYRTGAFFFLMSRSTGAAFRLFLVAGVLQLALFDSWQVDFSLTVLITILLVITNIIFLCLGALLYLYADTLQMLNQYSAVLFDGYQFGFEILLVNGALTFFGLLLLRKKPHAQ